MGVVIPQVVTGSRSTGAQVIDGSLKFNSSKSQYLQRTLTANGNRFLWTWSCWLKRTPGALHDIFSAGQESTNDSIYSRFRIDSSDALNFRQWDDTPSNDAQVTSNMLLRDPSAFFHYVIIYDSTQSTDADKVRQYINGQRVTSFSSTDYPALNSPSHINRASKTHTIGGHYDGGGSNADSFFNGYMNQVYFIDGQALGPEYFGFSDGLTNTWKPKKFDIRAKVVKNVNNGTTWSNLLTSPGTLKTVTEGFDGDLSGRSEGVGGLTFTPTGGIKVTSKVEVYDNNNVTKGRVVIDGVTQSYVQHATSSWVTLYSGSGTLDSLETVRTDNSAFDAGFVAIKIDDYILIDGSVDNSFYLPLDGNTPIGQDQSGNENDWTPTNFGGSLELDNPNVSGARPILNTTQGGSQAGVGVFGSNQNVRYAVTVQNDGGGNKYYIDGVKQATLTGLIRGATYTFDTSDSTVSSHPFRFSTTTQEGGGSATLYSNGVAAITGAATTITIPHDAPNTLYYYCTSHSGMGADITGITTNEKLADQYASSCVAALPLVGIATDESNHINITSTQKLPSVTGATFETGQTNFYNSSIYFDGPTNGNDVPTDFVTIPDSNSDFVIGTGDYTMEAWVWGTDWTPGTASEGQAIMGHPGAPGSEWIGFWSAAGLFGFYNAGSFVPSASPTDTRPTLSNEKWYHMAATRESGTVRCFLDGVLLGSTSSDTTNIGTGTFILGKHPESSTNQFNGYIQDARLYKGVAKYTSDFVVPSRSPDVLPDTPSGVSGSSKLTKITDGAVYFDGTGDHLRAASVSLNPNTSNFTIECFIYLDTAANEKFIVGGLDWFWLSCSYTGGSSGVTSGKFGFSMRNSANDTWYSVSSTTSFTSGRWYHVAATWDGTYQRMFVDGVLESTSADRSAITWASKTFNVDIGGYNSFTNYTIDGYISNLRIIDGTALYTKTFAPPPTPLTNVTNTEVLCCQSVGVTTAAAVGIVTAYNDATAINFNPFNTDINTVRGQETGYATFNPLFTEVGNNQCATISDGNLKAAWRTGDWNVAVSNLSVSSGKYYWEITASTNIYHMIGVIRYNTFNSTNGFYYSSDAFVYYHTGQQFGNIGGNTGTSYGASFTAGDVIGVALNLDAETITFYKNGVSQGVANTNLTTGSYRAVWGTNTTGTSAIANFGQKPFKFPPPDGFQPLNAANVRPVKVISRPDQYVGVTTYTGSGWTDTTNPSQSISSFNFKPDLVWSKSRSNTYPHGVFDSVRGPLRQLRANNTNIETVTTAGTNDASLISFDDKGFTVGPDNGLGSINYGGGTTYVAWAWKAGGNKNTFNVDDVGYATAAAAGITGLDGTNQMTTAKYLGCSIGTEQGFSIIKYNGLGGTNHVAIPHGLTQSPDLVMVKNLTDDIDWAVAHSGLVDNRELHLNTAQSSTNVAFLGLYKSEFTSTSFAVNYGASNLNYVNASGKDYIAYVWHNVPGLQKFGSYYGNGDADGPYIELGFLPALLIIKRTDGGGSWVVVDSERNTFNVMDNHLVIDSGANENFTTIDGICDFVSNGFKLRGSDGWFNNSSSAHYIYMAWAKAPSVDLYGGGANAR